MLRTLVTLVALLAVSRRDLPAHGFVPPPVVRVQRAGSLAPGGPTAAAFGRTTPSSRAATEALRNAAFLSIPWQAAFPVPSHEGYDPSPSLDAGLRQLPEDGGWARDPGRPSLVLVYDAANEDHRRAVQQLEQDARMVVAANLFNCFRADAATFGEAPDTVRLRTYDREGKFVAEVTGGRRIRGGFDALEQAFGSSAGRSLVKVLPTASSLLQAVAETNQHLRRCEEVVVCPDCGDERHDARTAVAALRQQAEHLRRDLATLR